MDFQDFTFSALAAVARVAPAIAFDAIVTALCEYDDAAMEHTAGDMPIPDGNGGQVTTTRTITLDLTDEDGDPDDSTVKIHDCTYPDGTKAIHLPYGPIVLVRRGDETVLVEPTA